MFDKFKRLLDKDYDTFCQNIKIIDDWIDKLCPKGSHDEWDRFPIVETDGVRENHTYNNFCIYDFNNTFKLIFEMKENDYWGKLRKTQDKYFFDAMGKKNYKLDFEDNRYYIIDPKDNTKFISTTRYKFYKMIKETDILDYFNFKMEEILLTNV